MVFEIFWLGGINVCLCSADVELRCARIPVALLILVVGTVLGIAKLDNYLWINGDGGRVVD